MWDFSGSGGLGMLGPDASAQAVIGRGATPVKFFIRPPASKIYPLRSSTTTSKGKGWGFNNKTLTQTKSTEKNNRNQTTRNKNWMERIERTNRANNNRKERQKGTTENKIEWNE
jgi:hypothetical protein